MQTSIDAALSRPRVIQRSRDTHAQAPVQQNPHIYVLAQSLCISGGYPLVIDLGGRHPEVLAERLGPQRSLVIASPAACQRAETVLPKSRVLCWDTLQVASLPPEVLAQSIVLCSDLHGFGAKAPAVLSALRTFEKICPFVLIASHAAAVVQT